MMNNAERRLLYQCLRNGGTGDDIKRILDRKTETFRREHYPLQSIYSFCAGYKNKPDSDTYDSLQQLLNSGVSVDTLDDSGFTLLMSLVSNGCPVHHLRLIFLKNPNVNHKNHQGHTVMCYFAAGYSNLKGSDSLKVLEYLIECGVNLDCPNRKCETLLIKLLQSKYPVDHLSLVLDKGADINCRDKQGRNIIHRFASVYKSNPGPESVGVLKFLVERGAGTNCADDKGDTPLMSLVKNSFKVRHLEIVLDKGVDIGAYNNNGCNVLDLLFRANCHSSKVLQILLEYGADPNKMDMSTTWFLYATICNPICFYKYSNAINTVACVQMLYNFGGKFNWGSIWKKIVLYYSRGRNEYQAIFCETVFKCALLQDPTVLNRYMKYSVNVPIPANASKLTTFVNISLTELQEMKDTPLNNHLTVFDFITETDCRRLGFHIRSSDFNVGALASKFLLYGDVIRLKAEIGHRWAVILSKLDCVSLTSRTGKPVEVSLGHDCIYYISRFLTNYQLAKFILASDNPEKKSPTSLNNTL